MELALHISSVYITFLLPHSLLRKYIEDIIWISSYLYVQASTLLFLAMCLITVDRFLCIYLHLKYNYIVTKTRLVKITVATWIVSALPGVPILVSGNIFPSAYSLIFAILNGIYVLITITIYAAIGCYFRRRRRSEFRGIRRIKTSFATSKQFIVPLLIVFTFIVFAALPKVIIIWLPFKTNLEIMVIFVHLLLICGIIIDPLIYVFLNRQLRNIALHHICCEQCFLTKLNEPVVLQNISAHHHSMQSTVRTICKF
ncbi:melanocyte-stimulating hormone receptor-like [Hydractinia symbiolongicarpus]|uniref:melanocyte-stimulating hormone receptor-like n=1 Tax=Hydractinia symbiolongicarpus TaxID=13093 RepID=UPI002549CC85|nr:melanocyte-stimulating hormone receptor-like [Hydractinia symbiolongicarpus]